MSRYPYLCRDGETVRSGVVGWDRLGGFFLSVVQEQTLVYESLDDAPRYPLSWRDLMAALLDHQVFLEHEVLEALQRDEEADAPPRRSLTDFR